MSDIASILSAASATGATSASTSSSSGSDSLSMNDFFELLAAQLQYQDPLQSGDSSGSGSGSGTDFLGEMAQFASLEALQNISAQYNYMLASNMVGKTVSYSVYNSATLKTTTGSGTVTAVKLSGTSPSCEVGGTWVSLSDITAVSSGSSSSSSSSASS